MKANAHRALRYRDVLARATATVVALGLGSIERPLAWCDLANVHLPKWAWRSLAALASYRDRPNSRYVLARINTGRPLKVAVDQPPIRRLLAAAGLMTTGMPARWAELREAAREDKSPRFTLTQWLFGTRGSKARNLVELVLGPEPAERDGSRLLALAPSFWPWRHQLPRGPRNAPRTGNGLRDAILSRPHDPRCQRLRLELTLEQLQQMSGADT